MKKVIILLTLFLSINSFGQEVNCENVFKIEIPKDMYLMDGNPDAVFEIANYNDEKYMMVIHESRLEYKNAIGSTKESMLYEYVNTLSDGFNEAFNSTAKTYDIPFKDYNAKKIEIEGESGEVDIICHTIAVETELHLFQICYWTLKDDNSKDKLIELFDVARTFEIN